VPPFNHGFLVTLPPPSVLLSNSTPTLPFPPRTHCVLVCVFVNVCACGFVPRPQVDAAISHYLEAGAYQTAIAAAIDSKQILKAAQLLDDVRDPTVARPFYLQIARHYQHTGALEEAEKFYVKGGQPGNAVDMYISAGRWEACYAVARQVRGRSAAPPPQARPTVLLGDLGLVGTGSVCVVCEQARAK
jgi:hypothetical protein